MANERDFGKSDRPGRIAIVGGGIGGMESARICSLRGHKVDLFEKMSGDEKLLYAVLLDRMNHSLKNGWQDENGNAYIICTIDEIMDSIRCARQKAVKLLDELEHEYQLIERRRQGLGKPNLLYVKDLY